jgi:nitrilase
MSKSPKKVLGGLPVVKVAVVQQSPAFMDRDGSLARAERYIAEAGAAGAQLVVFPEVWLAGYPYWTEGWDSEVQNWVKERVRFRDEAIVAPSEDTERLGAAAARAGVYLVMGCNELDGRPEVNTIYNCLLFFGPDGRFLGRHRKTMPTFVERLFWGQGTAEDLIVFDTDIGRLGGLICGEHAMTLIRAAIIAQGEDIHVACFPGAFAVHTGPRLEEPDTDNQFWAHASVRAHAMEAGAFGVLASGYLDPDDVPEDFAYRGRMNIDWSNGGSQVAGPLGFTMVEAVYGPAILYAELPADLLKATKAIIDTMGHYARPDLVSLQVKGRPDLNHYLVDAQGEPSDALKRAAEAWDADPGLAAEAHIEQAHAAD